MPKAFTRMYLIQLIIAAALVSAAAIVFVEVYPHDNRHSTVAYPHPPVTITVDLPDVAIPTPVKPVDSLNEAYAHSGGILSKLVPGDGVRPSHIEGTCWFRNRPIKCERLVISPQAPTIRYIP